MGSLATTDLLDDNEALLASGEVRVLAPGLAPFGRRTSFSGPCTTLRVFEDNGLIAEAVTSAGHARVLVVDGGGSRRCALFGGRLAAEAAKNGWAGIVIDGCVRDADEIDAADIGVRALAVHPRRPAKRGSGERDVMIVVAGATVRPGDWIYADRDGVVVSSRPLAPPR